MPRLLEAIFFSLSHVLLHTPTGIPGITGLITRTFFDEYLPREIKRARRSGKPISVILIDIDDFKAINDIYGHKKGDEVLKKVAGVIRSSVRSSEAVVRFGEDGILVVLPEAEEEGAMAVLGRIRERLKRVSKDSSLTMSAGIGVWDGSESFDDVHREGRQDDVRGEKEEGEIHPFLSTMTKSTAILTLSAPTTFALS